MGGRVRQGVGRVGMEWQLSGLESLRAWHEICDNVIVKLLSCMWCSVFLCEQHQSLLEGKAPYQNDYESDIQGEK